MILTNKVPRILKPLYESPKRYIILYGGRGSGKTWNTADNLVSRILADPDPDMLYVCLRQTVESLMDSTKSTILKAINQMGLNSLFYTARTSKEIICLVNGCKFRFLGCANQKEADKIRSIENVRLIWFEEAHGVKEEVWETITPSVRADNSKIIVTFNPMRKTDFMYDHFVTQEDDLAEVVNVNYYDNPFFWQNDALVQEMNAKKKFPHAFRRIWLGEPGFIENQLIRPEWWRYYETLAEAVSVCTGMFLTADTAYKTGTMHDYSVVQCWGYNSGNQLYLLDQIRGKWEFPTLIARIKSFTEKCYNLSSIVKPSRIYIEDKASGISLVQTLAREGLNVIAWKPKDYQFPDDKIGRANEAALIISTGVVYLPKNEGWVHDFVTEHSEFTDDKDAVGFDDQVDTTTMAISIWRKMGGGIIHIRG